MCKRFFVVQLVAALLLVACGDDSPGKDAGTGDVAIAETATGDQPIPSDCCAEDLRPYELPPDASQEVAPPDVKPELTPDAPAPEDLPLPDVELPPDVEAPELVAETSPDVPQPECTKTEDCWLIDELPGVCQEYGCIDQKCVPVNSPAGTVCDDGDPCTDPDTCEGNGLCFGPPKVCDDGDICTSDTCDPTLAACLFSPLPQKACVDGDGNPGVQECNNNEWGPCVADAPCKVKINANNTGTVNPFIFPAREGDFYVTYVAKEDDGGNMKLAWVDPETCSVVKGPFTVNDQPGGAYYWNAQWALSDGIGNFYAVWEPGWGFPGELRFAASETGETFGPSVEVVSNSENGIDASLAVLGPGNVIVVWSGYNGIQYDAYLSRNTNVFGGGQFSTAVQVASTKIQDDQTAVAVDSAGNIYVAWESFQDGTDEGGNIYVAKSMDGGQTFAAAVKVNDVAGKANVGIATFMAWGGDRLYLVWSDTRTDSEGDVYLDSSTDGLNFGADVMVNDSTYRYQEDPSVVVGQGTDCNGIVYVAWQDLRSNQGYEVWGARSATDGASFEPNKLLSLPALEDQMNPAIAVDPKCIVGVVWRDSETNDSFDIRGTFLPVW
jgi:hypothetical protein